MTRLKEVIPNQLRQFPLIANIHRVLLCGKLLFRHLIDANILFSAQHFRQEYFEKVDLTFRQNITNTLSILLN